MADDSHWIERAQSAEARLTTAEANTNLVKEKFRNMMATLGARERGDGTVDIDFAALVDRLSPEHALELRAAIDEKHRISGDPGAKPKITVAAG